MKLHTKILLASSSRDDGCHREPHGRAHPLVGKLISLVTEPLGRMWLACLIMVVIRSSSRRCRSACGAG